MKNLTKIQFFEKVINFLLFLILGPFPKDNDYQDPDINNEKYYALKRFLNWGQRKIQ